MRTVRELIEKGVEVLRSQSPTPLLDTEILLSFVTKLERIQIIIEKNMEVSDEEADLFLELIQQRASHMPIAYIIGKQEFMGIDFEVDRSTLIPRPDTEILVESVIDCIDREYGKKEIHALDIGTGSGAIPIAITHYRKNVHFKALDISVDALEMAKKNAVSNHVEQQIDFVDMDAMAPLKSGSSEFDILVSNPPYIRKGDLETLQSSVVDFEPITALDGGVDGLDFYRKISKDGLNYLKKQGHIFFEVGHDQASDVRKILEDLGYINIRTVRDLQNFERVVVAKRP